MGLKVSIKKVGRRAAEAIGLTYKLNELAASLQELAGHASHVDRGTQLLLAFKYRELASQGIRCSFDDIEFRNYSQNGADGILWYIFSIIGTTTKTCVEMYAECFHHPFAKWAYAELRPMVAYKQRVEV